MTSKQDTRFKPGQSGNPKGRTPGKLRSTILREQIAAHIPEILQVIIDRALDGDVPSARLLIERVSPPLKAIDDDAHFTLPNGTLADQARAVVKAVAATEINAAHGSQILNGISAVSSIVQGEELEKRLAALEERINAK